MSANGGWFRGKGRGAPSALRWVAVYALAICGLLALPNVAGAAETGSISGTVTEHGGTKAGIEGLCVTAVAQGSHEFPNEGVPTQAGGKYEITKLEPGKYTVSFHNCFEGKQFNFVPRYYNERTLETEAELVTVSGGAQTPNINAEMRPGAEIKGLALNTGGQPLANVCVAANSATVGSFLEGGSATTNAAGEYVIVGLSTGTYTVSYYGCSQNIVSAYYDEAEASGRTAREASATQITVKAEEEPVKPKQLNAVHLEAGGVIEGQITDSQGKLVTTRICVTAENLHPMSLEEQLAGSAITATGHYRIEGLTTGTYTLKIRGCSGKTEWTTQYYNGVRSALEATPISVTAGLEPPVPAVANVRLVRFGATRPINTSTPVASGTAAVGGALSCSPGAWSGIPAPTFSYQWLLGSAPIGGQTASTYTVQAADEGHTLSCVVTASNEVGAASSTSNPVQIPLPPSAPPKRVGAPRVNRRTGAITIAYEFPEGGAATLSGVVAHGANIARAAAARHGTRCRRGQVRRGGRCVSNGPVPFGSTRLDVSQAGTFALTIHPSGRVRAALRKGKSAVVMVTLVFVPARTTDRLTQAVTVPVRLARSKHGKH